MFLCFFAFSSWLQIGIWGKYSAATSKEIQYYNSYPNIICCIQGLSSPTQWQSPLTHSFSLFSSKISYKHRLIIWISTRTCYVRSLIWTRRYPCILIIKVYDCELRWIAFLPVAKHTKFHILLRASEHIFKQTVGVHPSLHQKSLKSVLKVSTISISTSPYTYLTIQDERASLFSVRISYYAIRAQEKAVLSCCGR